MQSRIGKTPCCDAIPWVGHACLHTTTASNSMCCRTEFYKTLRGAMHGERSGQTGANFLQNLPNRGLWDGPLATGKRTIRSSSNRTVTTTEHGSSRTGLIGKMDGLIVRPCAL